MVQEGANAKHMLTPHTTHTTPIIQHTHTQHNKTTTISSQMCTTPPPKTPSPIIRAQHTIRQRHSLTRIRAVIVYGRKILDRVDGQLNGALLLFALKLDWISQSLGEIGQIMWNVVLVVPEKHVREKNNVVVKEHPHSLSNTAEISNSMFSPPFQPAR